MIFKLILAPFIALNAAVVLLLAADVVVPGTWLRTLHALDLLMLGQERAALAAVSAIGHLLAEHNTMERTPGWGDYMIDGCELRGAP
jgi:hypothetical protein